MQVLVPGCTCGLHSTPLAPNPKALQLLKSCALSQRQPSAGSREPGGRPGGASPGHPLCLAAICDNGKSIVAVSDRSVSRAGDPSRGAHAAIAVEAAAGWWLMCSSADEQTTAPVLTDIRKRLWGHQRTAQDVAAALSSAYREQVKREAEDRYLGRFGMTLESFLSEGKKLLTNESFELFRERIEQIRLGCEIIIFGFDPQGLPHILTLRDPGIVDLIGGAESASFRAVGAGAEAAEGMLRFHQLSSVMPESLAVYHLCEAKFMADQPPCGGESTAGMVLHSSGRPAILHGAGIETIRSLWERHGKPRVHSDTAQMVSDAIRLASDHTVSEIRGSEQRESTGPSSTAARQDESFVPARRAASAPLPQPKLLRR